MSYFGIKTFQVLTALTFLVTAQYSWSDDSSKQPVEPWAQTVAKVIRIGDYIETPAGDFMTVNQQVYAEDKLSYTISYLSAVGGYNPEGVFESAITKAVYEEWALDENQIYHVLIWSYTLDSDGNILDFTHGMLLEAKRDNRVLETKNLEISKHDAYERWNGLKSQWLKWSQSESNSPKLPVKLAPIKAWKALIKKSLDEGTVIESTIGNYYSLSNINPIDVSKSHKANYFSAVANNDNQGFRSVKRVDLVYENWVKNEEGDWTVEQWTFHADESGKFVDGRRNVLEKAKNMSIKRWETLPTLQADIEAKFNELKEFWSTIIQN